jgi:5-methylcytosine-specific restriction endonuclease McrA
MPRRPTACSRIPDQQVACAVAKSTSIRQTLLQLGLHDAGANYKYIHRVVARLSLDTSHWTPKPERPSDEQIARAVPSSASLGQALQRLSLPYTGGNARFLRRAVTQLCLDTHHWVRMRDSLSDRQITQAVAESSSVAQVLRQLGLGLSGSNYRFVQRSVARLGLDTRHLLGPAHLRGKSHNWTESTPLDEILVENSTYGSSSYLKRRLIREAMLQPLCYECGISDWRGKPLALVLDHINGVYDDNRLENLRLLCPNCHSQTPTFAGRNRGRRGRSLTGEARTGTIQAG